MRIEPPPQLQPNCYDTFNLFTSMGIDWQFDDRAKQRGRIKQELGLYKVASSFRIEDWNSKIHRLRQEENLQDVVAEEENLDEKLAKNPDIQQVYDGLTAKEYSRRLRNRIRALKLRIKKKEEDQELQILRKMARRLNLLHHNSLLPKNHSELLMEKDENKFYKKLNQMRLAQSTATSKRLPNQASSSKAGQSCKQRSKKEGAKRLNSKLNDRQQPKKKVK